MCVYIWELPILNNPRRKRSERLHWMSGCSASRISCLREVHENKNLPSSTLVNVLDPLWWQDTNNRATVFVLYGVSGLWPPKCSLTAPITWHAQGCKSDWMRGPGWCCCATPEDRPAWGLLCPWPEIHALMHVEILMGLDQVQHPGVWGEQSLGRLKPLWNWVLIPLAWRALKL